MQQLEELARSGAGKADEKTEDEQRRLELEWQQLDFAISALEKGEVTAMLDVEILQKLTFAHMRDVDGNLLAENKQAPALESATVLDVRTRSELQDLNTQYSAAIDKLRSELGAEREALAREKQLHSDLDVVQVGLNKRLAQLQRKRTQDLTSESAIRYVSPLIPPAALHVF